MCKWSYFVLILTTFLFNGYAKVTYNYFGFIDVLFYFYFLHNLHVVTFYLHGFSFALLFYL